MTSQKDTTVERLAYSIRDAQAASGLGRSTLKELIRNKRLRVTRVGRRILIPAEELRRLVGGR